MEDSAFDLELRRRQFKGQTSTVQTRRQQAVCVRRAYKQYGSKSNPVIVLDGLNMTVPKGCIYGLLGASGCGKTTLLNCIVGRKRLKSGEIWVLGGKPGSRGSGVPGPRVGYMPQDLALYGEFTAAETLKYFGWISDMTTSQINQKIDFCVKLLMLPDAHQLVKNLSGGQQRRVSLAAALIHEPELLILDEPTVGVDPLLRAIIWDHLISIIKHGRTTVIITTHYIEETRKAHLIGLMRGGYFLAEESPERLLAQFNAETLEDVFLKLSVMQNRGKRRRSSILANVTETIEVPEIPAAAVNEGAVLDDEPHGEISGEFGDTTSVSTKAARRVSISPEPATEIPENDPEIPWTEYMKFLRVHHMKALMWKNFLWMWRNMSMMAFIIGLPLVQMALFCVAVGHDPIGIKLSVVNREIDFPKEHCKPILGCNSTRLSCNYLEYIAQNYSVELDYKRTEAEARHMVETGQSWGMLVVQHNFSDAFRERLDAGRNISEGNLYGSTISVFQDQSNQNIGQHITKNLLSGFWSFAKSYLISCDVDPRGATPPINWQNPIYGYGEPDFTNFASPGVILTIIFFMSIALTSGAMLMERNAGIQERCLVNGITGTEMLFSLALTQSLIMLGQTVLVVIVSFPIFNLVLEGSLVLVLVIAAVSGVCGMFYGFVIACACDSDRTAVYMALGSFLPIVLLCGIVWPMEGMNKYLKFIIPVLPLTQATESLRSVQARGWGISHPVVYNGFISMGCWIVIFLVISIILLKFKKG